MEDPGKKVMMIKARSSIYRFISSLFLTEPSPEVIREIRDKKALKTFRDLGIDFGVELNQGEEALAEKLAVEYTRLFIGPKGHFPPYESVHSSEGGTLWGDSTVEVSNFYRRCGYELAPEHSIPDHIGIELELMQHLLEMEAKSLREGDSALASRYVALQKEFLENHLVKWGPGFCRKIEEAAEHPFYRGLARLTRQYITAEYEGLE